MPGAVDKQDVRILKLLQHNANLTTGEVAEKTNMSQSPCWRRINRIEQDGLIKKRVAILDRDQLGMEVVVFATVNLSMQGRIHLEEFEQEVKSYPEVVECYTMTGTWDYMLKIITKDIRHYESFVRNQLAALPLVSEMHSHIAVTEIKNTTELPLDTQL
jgi:Lrp/AsnC family transcriptional regulator, cysteine-sensing transcriptional activator